MGTGGPDSPASRHLAASFTIAPARGRRWRARTAAARIATTPSRGLGNRVALATERPPAHPHWPLALLIKVTLRYYWLPRFSPPTSSAVNQSRRPRPSWWRRGGTGGAERNSAWQLMTLSKDSLLLGRTQRACTPGLKWPSRGTAENDKSYRQAAAAAPRREEASGGRSLHFLPARPRNAMFRAEGPWLRALCCACARRQLGPAWPARPRHLGHASLRARGGSGVASGSGAAAGSGVASGCGAAAGSGAAAGCGPCCGSLKVGHEAGSAGREQAVCEAAVTLWDWNCAPSLAGLAADPLWFPPVHTFPCVWPC